MCDFVIFSNYWMRLSRIWRVLQVEEGVIHQGRRPRWITSSEICRILHILRKGITHSGKYCAIQGARLIWKQEVWLVLTKCYCLLANHNPEFQWVICSGITQCTLFALVYYTFCTVLHLNCTVLRTLELHSKSSNFFVCIIISVTVSRTTLTLRFSTKHLGGKKKSIILS